MFDHLNRQRKQKNWRLLNNNFNQIKQTNQYNRSSIIQPINRYNPKKTQQKERIFSKSKQRLNNSGILQNRNNNSFYLKGVKQNGNKPNGKYTQRTIQNRTYIGSRNDISRNQIKKYTVQYGNISKGNTQKQIISPVYKQMKQNQRQIDQEYQTGMINNKRPINKINDSHIEQEKYIGSLNNSKQCNNSSRIQHSIMRHMQQQKNNSMYSNQNKQILFNEKELLYNKKQVFTNEVVISINEQKIKQIKQEYEKFKTLVIVELNKSKQFIEKYMQQINQQMKKIREQIKQQVRQQIYKQIRNNEINNQYQMNKQYNKQNGINKLSKKQQNKQSRKVSTQIKLDQILKLRNQQFIVQGKYGNQLSYKGDQIFINIDTFGNIQQQQLPQFHNLTQNQLLSDNNLIVSNNQLQNQFQSIQTFKQFNQVKQQSGINNQQNYQNLQQQNHTINQQTNHVQQLQSKTNLILGNKAIQTIYIDANKEKQFCPKQQIQPFKQPKTNQINIQTSHINNPSPPILPTTQSSILTPSKPFLQLKHQIVSNTQTKLQNKRYSQILKKQYQQKSKTPTINPIDKQKISQRFKDLSKFHGAMQKLKSQILQIKTISDTKDVKKIKLQQRPNLHQRYNANQKINTNEKPPLLNQRLKLNERSNATNQRPHYNYLKQIKINDLRLQSNQSNQQRKKAA